MGNNIDYPNEFDLNFYREEKKVIAPLGLVLIGSLIRNSTAIMAILNDTTKSAIDIGVKVIILLSLIMALQVIINRVSRNFWALSFLGLLFVGIHMIMFPENNRIFINTCITFVTTFYPCMLCLKSIQDYDYFFEKIVSYSKIVLTLNVIVFLTFLGGAFSGTVSMGYSMSFILPLNFVISGLFIKRQDIKPITIVIVIINILSILIYGSRGSLVSIIACTVVFFILFDDQINIKNKILFIFLSVLIAIIAIVFYKSILSFIISVINQMGVSSRSLNMLLENSFGDNNGRTMIWQVLINEIQKKPFAIRGINADQLLKTGFYQGSNTSHNVVLEMCYSFGMIIGPIFCIILFYKIFKCFHFIRNSYDAVKLVYLFSFFPICLWSGSLWESSWWYWICV